MNTASVSYPDGRMFYVIATSSVYGQEPGVDLGASLGHPVADRAQLAAFAESADWFG